MQKGDELNLKNFEFNKNKAIKLTKKIDPNLSTEENQKLQAIIDKCNTLYIGNFKKSPTTIIIYNKRRQKASVKKAFSVLKTRIETRSNPKNAFAEEVLDSTIKEHLKQGKKGFQELAKSNVSYSNEFYAKIFQDYSSEISAGLRNLMYLNNVVNGFTLNPNVRDKKLLTAWYVDNIITPLLVLVEKSLIENHVFMDEVLTLYKQKTTAKVGDKIITINEPLVVNGEPCLDEEQRFLKTFGLYTTHRI